MLLGLFLKEPNRSVQYLRKGSYCVTMDATLKQLKIDNCTIPGSLGNLWETFDQFRNTNDVEGTF